MQILRFFIGFNTVSLRIHTLVIYYRGGLCGASVLAPSRRRRGEVSTEAPHNPRIRPGSVPTKEGWRSGLIRGLEGMEFCFFRLVVLALCVGRGRKEQSPSRCVGLPKTPKTPKIPFALDDIWVQVIPIMFAVLVRWTGEPKRLP